MREWINLFESNDNVAQSLHRYVMENIPIDHHEAARALVSMGYQDPHKAGRYYRALYHNVKDAPVGLKTYGDLYAHYRKNPSFLKKGPASFCDTIEGAFQYVGGTIHLVSYDGRTWPEHRLDTPLERLSGGQFWLVYEMEVPESAILWSIKGLRQLLIRDSNAFGESTHLVTDFITEYGWQDEIVIDSDHATVVDVHSYDSSEDEEEYNYKP